MAQVAIALGSNLNDPHKQLKIACKFLRDISNNLIAVSSIFESEPIGPSEFNFLNAVVLIKWSLSVETLFSEIKTQEYRQGRPTRYPKWTARTIDMDIICYDKEIIHSKELIIPHTQYKQRLFVLLPLQEVLPNWIDPETQLEIDKMIEIAPNMSISRTNLMW